MIDLDKLKNALDGSHNYGTQGWGRFVTGEWVLENDEFHLNTTLDGRMGVMIYEQTAVDDGIEYEVNLEIYANFDIIPNGEGVDVECIDGHFESFTLNIDDEQELAETIVWIIFENTDVYLSENYDDGHPDDGWGDYYFELENNR